MNKTHTIVDEAIRRTFRQDFHTFPSHAAYTRFVRRALVSAGQPPYKATYDPGNNCHICGECGRCPGYHTADEVGLVPLPLF